jgi:hypothetical protein
MNVNELLRISFLIEYKFENKSRISNNLVISLRVFPGELKNIVSLIVFLKSKTMMNLKGERGKGGTTPRFCMFAA